MDKTVGNNRKDRHFLWSFSDPFLHFSPSLLPERLTVLLQQTLKFLNNLQTLYNVIDNSLGWYKLQEDCTWILTENIGKKVVLLKKKHVEWQKSWN